MKKKSVKWIAALCALGCIGVVGGVRIHQDDVITPTAEKYELTFSSEIAESYPYGAEFNLPTATISYGGQQILATESVLVFPDGKVQSVTSVMLTTSGEYTLIYYATVDGKTISAEKIFTVEAEVEWDGLSPVVTIEGGFAKETMARSALNEKVTIPAATATDENLVGGVETYVYYNYGTTQQVQIGVMDNAFTPTVAGEYTIVYIARDAYGNVTQVERSVLVSAVTGNKAVTLTVGASEKAVAGTTVKVPAVTLGGLYEDASALKTYVQFGDEERVELKENEFFAEHVGEYTVTYVYVTPLQTYTATVALNVISENKIIFEDYATPTYFIKDAYYTLDEVYATSYSEQDPVRSVAKAFIKQDNGAWSAIDYEKFLVTASNSVQFKFETMGEALETEVFEVVDVNFGGELKMQEYFVGEVDKLTTIDGIIITVPQAKDKTEVAFVNVVSLSSFNFEFNVPVSTDTETYGKISTLTIRLTDYYDREKSVELQYINEGGMSTLSLDGARAVTLSRNFMGTKNNLYFDVTTSLFYDSTSGVSWAWENEFTSDKVLLSVVLEKTEANARIAVKKVGEQTFNDGVSDKSKPTVYIENIQQGSWLLNDEVLLQQAAITDVMSPYLKENVIFSVKMPDGSYAPATDGTNLNGNCDVARDYTLKLTQYGTYKVSYTYTDQNGRSENISYSIFVYDRRPPVITLDERYDGEVVKVKAGETVDIDSYSVSDGETPTEELVSYVSVFNPTGTYMPGAITSFTTNYTGTYRVVYYCMDGDGNYTTVSYTVIAE